MSYIHTPDFTPETIEMIETAADHPDEMAHVMISAIAVAKEPENKELLCVLIAKTRVFMLAAGLTPEG